MCKTPLKTLASPLKTLNFRIVFLSGFMLGPPVSVFSSGFDPQEMVSYFSFMFNSFMKSL